MSKSPDLFTREDRKPAAKGDHSPKLWTAPLWPGEYCIWRPVMIGERPMHECTRAQLEAELNVMRSLYRAFGELSARQMDRVALIKHFIELADEERLAA